VAAILLLGNHRVNGEKETGQSLFHDFLCLSSEVQPTSGAVPGFRRVRHNVGGLAFLFESPHNPGFRFRRFAGIS
jgi:hypothetical protein